MLIRLILNISCILNNILYLFRCVVRLEMYSAVLGTQFIFVNNLRIFSVFIFQNVSNYSGYRSFRKKKISFSVSVPQTRVHRTRIRRGSKILQADSRDDMLEPDTYEFCGLDEVALGGIVIAWRLCCGAVKRNVDPGECFVLPHKSTKSHNFATARVALADWLLKRTVPDDAVLYLTRHHCVDVWEKEPLLRNLIVETLEQNASLRRKVFRILFSQLSSVWPKIRHLRDFVLKWQTVDSVGSGDEYEEEPVMSPAALLQELEFDITPDDDFELPDELVDSSNSQWEDLFPEVFRFQVTEKISAEHERIAAQLLDENTLNFVLGQSNIKLNQQLPIQRLLAHWYVDSGTTLEGLGILLRLVHSHKVKFDYRDLPRSTKTLLKLFDEDKNVRIRKIHSKAGTADGCQELGEYIHYGILNGVKCSSLGE